MAQRGFVQSEPVVAGFPSGTVTARGQKENGDTSWSAFQV